LHVRVSVAFAIGLGRYLSGFAEFIELRLKASTRLNHGRIIWMRRAACHARFGSLASILTCQRHVRLDRDPGHAGGTVDQFGAGIQMAVDKGWMVRHESGTYLKFTDAGAALFA
jgi:hypothetical protein